MPRNVVICCDGTGNKLDVARTNVVRLFTAVRRDDPETQVAYYHPGVGTMPARAALTSITRASTKLAGAAVGYGLLDTVADLYAYLMTTVRPKDRLFLFGFSRGAFTVRVLAGLLNRCGLLRQEFANLIPYALDLYRPHEKRHEKQKEVVAEFRKLFARDCRVHFLGLWDTVKAFGILWPRSLPHLRFNDSVDVVRHALALEERRLPYAHTTWGGVDSDGRGTPGRRGVAPRFVPAGQHVKEVWFAGCHSDVGGGSHEAEGSLYKQPLEWMVREAQHHDLRIDERVLRGLLDMPAGLPAKIESLTGAWWLAEGVLLQLRNEYSPPRRRPAVGLGRGRRLSASHRGGALTVHESVPAGLLRALQHRDTALRVHADRAVTLEAPASA